MTSHQQDTATNPEQAPPALQFHHIDGGEVNLNLEGLSPKEKLAAEFAVYVRNTIVAHNGPQVRSEAGVEDKGLKGSYGIQDARADFRQKGIVNLLKPARIAFYANTDTNMDLEFYSLEFSMADSHGNVSDEPVILTAAFEYDAMPAVDAGETPEFVIRNVDLEMGEIGEEEFDSPADFLAAFKSTFDSARDMLATSYEPEPIEQ